MLIAGMYAPRNNGEAYAKAFDASIRASQKHGAMLYPSSSMALPGCEAEPRRWNPSQPAGVRVIVERILPTVEAFLASLRKS